MKKMKQIKFQPPFLFPSTSLPIFFFNPFFSTNLCFSPLHFQKLFFYSKNRMTSNNILKQKKLFSKRSKAPHFSNSQQLQKVGVRDRTISSTLGAPVFHEQYVPVPDVLFQAALALPFLFRDPVVPVLDVHV